MQRKKVIGFIFISTLLIGACSTTTDLSDELPYETMIGQCYVLQKDMNIVETQNKCWAMGDMALTPYLRAHCLADKIAEVPQGTEFTIAAVKLRKGFQFGSCPVLSIEFSDKSFNGVLSPTVCGIVRILDWREGEQRSWFLRGDPIELRADYVKRCNE